MGRTRREGTGSRPRPGGTAGRACHRVGHARPGQPNRHITSRLFHPKTPSSFHAAPHCGGLKWPRPRRARAGLLRWFVFYTRGRKRGRRCPPPCQGPLGARGLPPAAVPGPGRTRRPQRVPAVLPPGASQPARSPAVPRGAARPSRSPGSPAIPALRRRAAERGGGGCHWPRSRGCSCRTQLIMLMA